MEGRKEKEKGEKEERRGKERWGGEEGLRLGQPPSAHNEASLIPPIPEPSFPPVSMVPNSAIHNHTPMVTHCHSFIAPHYYE